MWNAQLQRERDVELRSMGNTVEGLEGKPSEIHEVRRTRGITVYKVLPNRALQT